MWLNLKLGAPISRLGANRKLRQRALRRLGFVRECLPENSIGIELGVMKGHFSEVLLEQLRPKELHLVDMWHLGAPDWPWAQGDNSTVNALIKVLQHFKAQIEAGTVTVHVGDDRQILQSFPDHHFDWAYIDSSHFYEHTLEELLILRHKVKPDGVITGDDWWPDASHRHHGVYKAVVEFNEQHGYELFYTNDCKQWAIRKRA